MCSLLKLRCAFLSNLFIFLNKNKYLQNPTAADSGPYRCLIKNEIGEIQATLNLNIEGTFGGIL